MQTKNSEVVEWRKEMVRKRKWTEIKDRNGKKEERKTLSRKEVKVDKLAGLWREEGKVWEKKRGKTKSGKSWSEGGS